MKLRRIFSVVVALVAVVIGYCAFILDWRGRPTCHKQIMGAFGKWTADNGNDPNSGTNEFPNMNGRGTDSLLTTAKQMGGYMDWVKTYNYVPGLHENDPGDLVLLYMNRSTRWTWHGKVPTVFKKKEWIVVPVDFAFGERPRSGPGELSERIPIEEFRERLKRTLDFIRTNERPNWEKVVAEHTKFLDSIESIQR